MEKRRAAFIHSPDLEKYQYPPQSPFDVSRAGKMRKVAESMGLLSGDNVAEVAPAPAERLALKKFHSARYLRTLKRAAEGKFEAEAFYMGIGTPDCPVFDDMYDYSAHACGATLKGVELLISNAADVAFNPSGGLHHAGPERASGFCYLNDVTLGCMVLAEHGKRVLYLDVDVHHGDGVQNAFYGRNDVMTISFHESPRTLFPGTGFEYEIGTGVGKGYSVNVPLPVGTYDLAYLKAYKALAEPLIAAFDPDVIVFELGADALADDPLANLQLTNNTYVEIINSLLSFNKPILMTGGGGYHLGNTVRTWALGWSVLCGAEGPQSAEIVGLGGVMLEKGGLKDIEQVVSRRQRNEVMPAIDETIEAVKANVFGLHNL